MDGGALFVADEPGGVLSRPRQPVFERDAGAAVGGGIADRGIARRIGKGGDDGEEAGNSGTIEEAQCGGGASESAIRGCVAAGDAGENSARGGPSAFFQQRASEA